MARKPNVFPSYLRHSSGQARIRVNGRDIMLGLYGSDESRVKYGQLFAKLSGGVPLDPIADSQRGKASRHDPETDPGPRVSNHFLLNVIYAMNSEIYRITAGSTIPTIGMPEVKRMMMPLPPLEEQLSIVSFLLKARERFQALIAEAQRAIDLLQERRTALISAAVTGQIDVRGLTS